MKKIVSLLVIALLLSALALPAGAKTAPLLQDLGDLLTESEEREVLSQLESMSQKIGCDVAVLTLPYCEEGALREYAENWYLSQGYGEDGVLLVISLADRNAQILTSGLCREVFPDGEGVDALFDSFLSDLSRDDYRRAFLNFGKAVRDGVERFDPENREFPGKYNFAWVLGAAAAGLVAAFVVTRILKGQLKSVSYQSSAAHYTVPGSLHLSRSSDLFLYANVTRTAKPKPSNNSGSHHSSGRSFGGGSRHF